MNNDATSDIDIDLTNFMGSEPCLAMRARRLSRVLTRAYEDALRDLGLTVPQFTLLTAIAANGPMTAGDICRRLDLEKSTLSRTLGKMMERDWVEEQQPSGSPREIHLTPFGRRTLREAVPAWQAVQSKAKETFGQQSLESLDRMIADAHEI